MNKRYIYNNICNGMATLLVIIISCMNLTDKFFLLLLLDNCIDLIFLITIMINSNFYPI